MRAKLKITYDPPSPADQAYVAALFDLLHHLLTWRLQSKGPGDATGTARLAAWGRLRDFFSGPFDGDRIYHYCPYGCHASREHAAESLVQDLTALMIDHPPVVPSANKWSKLLPPVLWFGMFTAWSSLLPALVRCLHEPYDEMPVFDEDALLGLDTRKAWQQQDTVRMKKTQNFLTAPSTPDKLMAMCITLRPVGVLMNQLFKVSRRFDPATSGILTFIDPATNPIPPILGRYCAALQDMGHAHWIPLLRRRAWNEALCVVAATLTWSECGQLVGRFLKPLDRWPWRLGLLASTGVSHDRKVQIAGQLAAACEHCDAFTQDYRQRAPTVEAILSPPNLQFTQELFARIPASNIACEASFAGMNTRGSATHGNAPCLTSVAASHVLTSAKTNLDLFMEQQLANGPVLQEPPRQSRNPWCNFFKEKKDGAPGLDAAAIATMWRQLPAEEKARYERPGRPIPPCPEPAPPRPVLPWPYTGDSVFPIREDRLSTVVDRVRELSKAWSVRIGNAPVQGGPDLDVRPPRLCEAAFGKCRCGDTLDAATKEKLNHFKKRFMRWTSISKSKQTTYNAAAAPLPLFYIGAPDGGAAGPAEPGRRGLLALLINPCLQNMIYACEETGTVRPGNVVHIRPSVDSMKDSTELAWMWLGLPDNAVAYSISYKQSGLADFHVTGVTEMHQLEMDHAEGRLQARRAAAVAKFMRSLDQSPGGGPKRRCAGRRFAAGGSHAGRATKKAKVAQQPAESSTDEDGNINVVDEDDALAAFDLDIVKEAAEHDEAEGNPSDPSDGEEEEEAIEAANAGVPVADPGDAAGEDLELPIVDARGSVRNPADENDIWGRISIVKEGTTQEAVSLYCRRHGCALMKSSSKAPPLPRMLRWFALGQDLPKIRAVAVQARHKHMFQELCAL